MTNTTAMTDTPAVKLFLTTAKAYESKKTTGVIDNRVGKFFTLTDYASSEHFWHDARTYASEELNDNAPDFEVIQVYSNFDYNHLINSYGPRDDLWQLLNSDISAHDLSLVSSYIATRALGADTFKIPLKQALELARASLMGYFETSRHLTEAWLAADNPALSIFMPSLLTENIDYNAIKDQLLDTELTESFCFYFYTSKLTELKPYTCKQGNGAGFTTIANSLNDASDKIRRTLIAMGGITYPLAITAPGEHDLHYYDAKTEHLALF